jgi:hypothetical protein
VVIGKYHARQFHNLLPPNRTQAKLVYTTGSGKFDW